MGRRSPESDLPHTYLWMLDETVRQFGLQHPPERHQKREHLLLGVNHYGRHKASLVADGHLTK